MKGKDALQEDLLFHLAIAKACGNSTIHTMMSQITPKLISVFDFWRIIKKEKQLLNGKSNRNGNAADIEIDVEEIERHVAIYEAIRDQKPQLAVKCMEKHFEAIFKKIV